MGTRGCWGYRLDGQDKLFYNHFDSYPSGLGETIVKHARKQMADPEAFKARAAAILMVKSDTPPDEAYRQKAIELRVYDAGVGGEDEWWYKTTRGCQGDPDKTLALGAGFDGSSFPADSLFCEFAYIINFDDGVIEFYRGFNHNSGAAGRYAALKERADNGYCGIALVGTAPLKAIPRNWEKKFFGADEDDEAA